MSKGLEKENINPFFSDQYLTINIIAQLIHIEHIQYHSILYTTNKLDVMCMCM